MDNIRYGVTIELLLQNLMMKVVHHQHEAVILTLVAGSEASTGLMISMTETMRPFLADVSAVISDPPQRSTPF